MKYHLYTYSKSFREFPSKQHVVEMKMTVSKLNPVEFVLNHLTDENRLPGSLVNALEISEEEYETLRAKLRPII
jgi:hypothetical protein